MAAQRGIVVRRSHTWPMSALVRDMRVITRICWQPTRTMAGPADAAAANPYASARDSDAPDLSREPRGLFEGEALSDTGSRPSARLTYGVIWSKPQPISACRSRRSFASTYQIALSPPSTQCGSLGSQMVMGVGYEQPMSSLEVDAPSDDMQARL